MTSARTSSVAGEIVLKTRSSRRTNSPADEQPVGLTQRDDRHATPARARSQSAWFHQPSVQRQVVGTGVPSGRHLGPLHEQVIQQAGGADTEEPGIQPVIPRRLVDQHQVPDGVLGGADPAGRLDARPAGRSPPRQSRTASSMTSVTGSVAAGVTLPVEVLMKSAPASMASQDARRTLSSVPSSPVSRITLRCAPPHAPRTAAISS